MARSRSGSTSAVLVRSAAELKARRRENPFVERGEQARPRRRSTSPSWRTARRAKACRRRSSTPDRSPPDAFDVRVAARSTSAIRTAPAARSWPLPTSSACSVSRGRPATGARCSGSQSCSPPAEQAPRARRSAPALRLSRPVTPHVAPAHQPSTSANRCGRRRRRTARRARACPARRRARDPAEEPRALTRQHRARRGARQPAPASARRSTTASSGGGVVRRGAAARHPRGRRCSAHTARRGARRSTPRAR